MSTTKSTGTALATTTVPEPSVAAFQAMERMAATVAKSGLYGMKTTEQALTLMLLSRAEGIDPMAAVRDYHVISGRPALKADTMLARFQSSGGRVDWKEYSDTRVVGVFSHPQAGSVTIDWDMERAKRAGLAAREPWKNYPRAMMRARVISEGVRTCFPGVAIGTYTVEEAQDMEIDVTPIQTRVETAAEAVVTALTQDEVEEHVNAMLEATTLDDVKAAYLAGYNHAKQAKDNAAKKRFDDVWAARSAEFSGTQS